MKLVAIEEHVLPADIKRAWETLPGADDGTLALNPPIIDERLADLADKRLALMDETGVDMQVLSLTTPGLNNLAEPGIELARRANELMAATVRGIPARFQFLAALSFADADTAASELRRAVLELGAKGGMLYGRVGDRHLDDALFEATYACAADLNVPLLIHPQIPQAAVRASYYSGFTRAVDLALSTFSLDRQRQCRRLAMAGEEDTQPREDMTPVLSTAVTRHPSCRMAARHALNVTEAGMPRCAGRRCGLNGTQGWSPMPCSGRRLL